MASQNRDPTAAPASTRTKEVDNRSCVSNDGHSVTKRLQRELLIVLTCGLPGISAFPDIDNAFKWLATIVGAKGTVYEGLTYKLDIEFPSSYPYKAPTVTFRTPCYHPNVDQHGNICLDILKEKWSALYDAKGILLSIQSLLGEPNNESPLNGHAAALWENQVAYKAHLHEKYKQATESGKRK